MNVRQLHPWDVSPAEAVRIQSELARQVIRTGDLDASSVRRVAGADISVEGKRGRAAVVVLSYPDLELVEQAVAEEEVNFPYIPGLLAFREVPILAQAFAQIDSQPDLLLVDGHGYSHFRRFGLACHLGLLLELPTIGCAKSRLCGEHGPLGDEPGSRVPLEDEGEIIGLVARTRPGVRPIYVSVGHRIGLEEAADWVLRLCRGHRLPEPTRLADQLAGGRLALAAAPRESSAQLSLF